MFCTDYIDTSCTSHILPHRRISTYISRLGVNLRRSHSQSAPKGLGSIPGLKAEISVVTNHNVRNPLFNCKVSGFDAAAIIVATILMCCFEKCLRNWCLYKLRGFGTAKFKIWVFFTMLTSNQLRNSSPSCLDWCRDTFGKMSTPEWNSKLCSKLLQLSSYPGSHITKLRSNPQRHSSSWLDYCGDAFTWSLHWSWIPSPAVCCYSWVRTLAPYYLAEVKPTAPLFSFSSSCLAFVFIYTFSLCGYGSGISQ